LAALGWLYEGLFSFFIAAGRQAVMFWPIDRLVQKLDN